LEASGYRPALFEVAQLIDDFGVIPVDDAGFKMRLRLARQYLQYLTTFGLPIEPPPAALAAVYSTFWVLRSAFGIGLFRRRSKMRASSSLRKISNRHEHHRQSLTYLESLGPTVEVRNLAKWINQR